MKRSFISRRSLFLIAIAIMVLSAFSVHGHVSGPADVYVRVVSANPSTKTYTFSCTMDPDNNIVRDWFIRPDYGNINVNSPEEATILDKPSGEHLTYTFKENTLYHIGCIIVDTSVSPNAVYRGDMHIDLRTGSWNPEIVPVSANGLTATYECKYSNGALTPTWEVVDARTGAVSNLGSGKTKTHTVSGHGLYDYICNVDGKGTGLPVEYFDSGNPYFPNQQGVPHGVKNTWDGSSGGGGGTTTGSLAITSTPGGAAVTVNGASVGTTTAGSSGTLTVQNVAAGTKTVTVSLSGYQTYTNNAVTVTAGQTTNLNVVLQQSSGGGGGTGTSYTNLQNIPATCEGGTISADTYDGGRHITCSGGGKTMKVDAWDKPTSTSPQYFEMYRVSGSGLKICLLTTCISDNGYAKSPNYPLSGSGGGTGGTTTGTLAITSTPGGASVTINGASVGTTSAGSSGTLTVPNVAAGTKTVTVSLSGYQTYTNNAVTITGGQTTNLNVVLQQGTGGGGGGTTYNNLQNIPATCEGGTISADTYDGGRHITCSGNGKTMKVDAWDKPTSTSPQYFEMYRVSGSGLRICLLSTCISDNGYAKSPNYPLSGSGSGGGTGGGTTTGTIALTTTPGGAAVTLNGNSVGTTTAGSSGTLNIPNAPAGTNTITVSLTGYQTYTNNAVSVTGGQTTNLNVVLQQSSGGGGGTGTSYTNLQNIPATCEGGTISADTYDGGRHITCSGNGKTMKVDAWDKPTSTSPQYFEMYRVSGSGLKICLLTTCISDNGYAKSPNYPLSGSGGGTGGGTGGKSTPQWLGTIGNTGVSPNYFHLEVQEAPDTGSIVSSDWEVWTQGMGSRVWNSLAKTGTYRYHVHTPDGSFEGSLAGQTQLNFGTTYNARVRFKYNDGTYGPWSSTYIFTTLTQQGGTGPLQWTASSGFKVETFASGLNYPVHVAAAPPGMYDSLPDNQEPFMYVTELYGQVKVIHKDKSVATYAQNLLNFDPFGSITGGGQMGVIGLYVDDATGDLFVGMTYLDANDNIKNKVVRFVSTNDGNSYSSTQTIISNLPSSASHQVEQITKGPDGKLYVNLGDALTPSNAQSDSIMAGKIIRMNMDGSGVEVYAKGFRNPFGADWRPGYGVLYATDNAPDQNDRIVKVLQGQNYGWGLNDNFATWNSKAMFYTDVSPVDVEFNPGGKGFPTDLNGRMYVAVAGPVYTQGQTESKHILEFVLDGSGNIVSNREFVKYTGSGYGTPMGLDFGPDGLYFTDIYGEAGSSGYGSEGRLLRVVQGTPDGSGGGTGQFRTNIYISPWYPQLNGNQVNYQFTCHPVDGTAPYTFDWIFGDGNAQYGDTYNENGDGKVIHAYPYTNQQYAVSCTARDSTGKTASASMTINPSNYIAEQQ